MKIFISSTFVDLRTERLAAIEALHATKIAPKAMEFFASEPSKPLEVALRELGESDAVILLIGFRCGSLLPDSTDSTYTSAEFDRAKELGKPIFVFIKTDGGIWRNQETDEPYKATLDSFKARVSFETPAYFETSDKLQYEVVQAIVNWNALGRPGARKTFATLAEHFPPPKAGSLFDYEQTFRGRSKESQVLDSFLKDDRQLVAIVTGRGGIGKSKLIKDWAANVIDRSVIILRDAGLWHEESDKEIPAKPALIIADDAHHSNEIPALLSCVKLLSEKRPIKVILATRLGGLSSLDAAIARRFDPAEVLRIKLEALGQNDVKALAEETLGADHRRYAAALVQISADTPLVTVVGGRLIARGDIAPQLLVNEEDFRRAVFDKFVEECEKNLPGSRFEWSSLLPLIAALQPIRPRQDVFKELAEGFLKRRSDEILQAIDILEHHGVLLRGGNLVRIVPDVLADYLLERACINHRGESTGYATALFEHFGASFLSSILRNLGELDWRIGQKHPSASLLDGVWKEISEAFRHSDASGRVHLLKSLKEATVFQPERTLELIRFALSNEAVSVTHFGFITSQQDVLNELPLLLQEVSYHFTHFDEAVRILFKLAQQDQRAPNRYPEHASKILVELASYGRFKPGNFNERIGEIADSIARESGAFDKEFTPLTIASKLLAKEGEYTESEGYTFTLGGFSLNYSVIEPIRRKALAMVESSLYSASPKQTRAALKVVEDVLSGFFPHFRSVPTPEEKKWQDGERIAMLDILAARLNSCPSAVLAREIQRVVHSALRHADSPDFEAMGNAMLASAQESEEVRVFDAICTPYWENHRGGGDFAEMDREHFNGVRKATETFRALYPTHQSQIEQLRNFLSRASEFQIDAREPAQSFVSILCEDAAFCDSLGTFLVRDSAPELGHLMWCVLFALRSKDPAKSLAVALEAAVHPNPEIASAAAYTSGSGVDAQQLSRHDLTVLQKVAAHPHMGVRIAALLSVPRLVHNLENHEGLVELLLGVDIGDNKRAAHDMFMAFAPKAIPMSSLSERQVRSFLEKLIPITEVNEYWIEQFLGWAGEAYPGLTFKLFLDRLEFDGHTRKTTTGRTGYHPIPFAGLNHSLAGIQKSSEYSSILTSIRDRLIERDVLERFWVRNLFWSAAAVDDTALLCIDEWFHSNDETKVQAAINLVAEGPEEIAFAKPAFAVHAIECASGVSAELADSALGAFTTNAFKGGYSSSPGQPAPRHVSAKERAQELIVRFPPVSFGQKLFCSIHDYAERMIKDSLIDDEEFRFEN